MGTTLMITIWGLARPVAVKMPIAKVAAVMSSA
jgi:hypothetical protein